MRIGRSVNGLATKPAQSPVESTRSSRSMTSVWFMLRAQCQGLSPALLDALTLAPRLSSSLTPSAHPSHTGQHACLDTMGFA